MASEIRVNKLNSQTGVGTITLSPTGVDISGITTAETLKATTGIVTTLTATTGIVTTFEATTGDITTLRAPTGIVTSLEATTGDITTLRAPTGIVTSFVTNTAKVGAAVTITESGIEASGIGITCANINGTQIGGRRNMVINGAMTISQRGTTFNSVATSNVTIDRFRWEQGGTSAVSAWNVTQKSNAARDIGFEYSLKVEVATVDSSLASNHYSQFKYLIEAQDIIKQASYGLSTAKKMTLSFYVKSSVTGTFPLALNDGSGSRSNPHVYTINSANTWEKKVITFVGDTGGNWQSQANNGAGFGIRWGLAVGSGYFGTADGAWAADSSYANLYASYSNSLVTTQGATWELTGVQLEVGSQATPFEHRNHQEELHLCKRYYQRYPESPTADNYNCVPSAIMACNNTTTAYYCPTLNPTMRTSPTFSSSGNFRMNGTSSVNNVAVTAIGVYHNGAATPFQYASVASGLTAGQAVALSVNNDATAYIAYDAEV